MCFNVKNKKWLSGIWMQEDRPLQREIERRIIALLARLLLEHPPLHHQTLGQEPKTDKLFFGSWLVAMHHQTLKPLFRVLKATEFCQACLQRSGRQAGRDAKYLICCEC